MPTAAAKNPSISYAGSRASLKSVLGMSLTATFIAFLGRSPGLFLPWRRAAVFQQGADGINECRTACAQLADAVPRHQVEQLLAARQQGYQYAPAVVTVAAPAHVAVRLQPVDEFDGAVMFQRQPVRQGPDGSLFAFGKAADGQQEQILLRLQARRLRHRVPFTDELANEVTELREGLILRRGDFFGHQITISQCDICFHSRARVDSYGIRISASTCRGAACCAPLWQPVDVIAALDSRGNDEVRNCSAENPGLQRFAERFLRFVMLVTVAFVELVRALTNYIRPDRHALTTVFARPIFGGGQQPRARSEAPLPFGDDKAVHFRPNLNFQQRLLAHMHPADHSILRSICHEYGVQRGRLDSQQPFAHLRRRRGIPELAREHGKLRSIAVFRSTNFQFSMHRSFCHSFFSAIPQRALRLSVIVSLL